MLYRQKLEMDIEEVRPELNIVRNASQELRTSTRFRKVLQVYKNLVEAGLSLRRYLDCVNGREYFEWFYFPRRCEGFPAQRTE